MRVRVVGRFDFDFVGTSTAQQQSQLHSWVEEGTEVVEPERSRNKVGNKNLHYYYCYYYWDQWPQEAVVEQGEVLGMVDLGEVGIVAFVVGFVDIVVEEEVVVDTVVAVEEEEVAVVVVEEEEVAVVAVAVVAAIVVRTAPVVVLGKPFAAVP